MRLLGLFLFILALWIIILGISFFLTTFVAPIKITILENNTINRIITSIIQASTAFIIIIIFILSLNKMKSFYMSRLRAAKKQ